MAIHVDNVNTDKFKKESNKKYTLTKTVISGLIVAAMIPGLVGCGIANDIPVYGDVPNANHTFYMDEDRETLYLGINSTFESLEELEECGETIRRVEIDYAFSVDDLSLLVEYCPNIEEVDIYYAPSISDLSFLYNLPNLRKVNLYESGYITPELVEYLDSKGIEHNITQQDLENNAELDRIIDEIITDDMTDEEKVQAVTLYIIDNYGLNPFKAGDSNERPLTSMFENRGGVCAGYAYLTNILLRRAGVNSYEVVTTNDVVAGHAWNLIEIDGKYYYLDAFNLDNNQIPFVSRLILEKFNIGLYYMTDPSANSFSAMIDYDKVDRVSIPPQMIADIEKGETSKSLIDKYGNSVPARFIEALIVIVGVADGLALAGRGMSAIKKTASGRKMKSARRRGYNNRKKKNIKNSRKKDNRTKFANTSSNRGRSRRRYS